jgi:hypothetical protein
MMLAAVLAAARLPCQSAPAAPSGASSPEALATLVMQTFSSGTPEQFAAIYPDSAGRVFMREARGTRQTELAKVIWRGPRRAVLLLGGVVRGNANAGRTATVGSNETNGARHFSGFYEAIESGGVWRLTHQIPLDSASFVRSQNLAVEVEPATGITVLDSVGIAVGAVHGFGVRLNNAANIRDLRLDGQAADYAFGGGLLWVRAPVKPRSLLVLSYTIAATRPGRAGADTGTAAVPAFGAFHNTDAWHPFFDYLSANHLAPITATVRIPAEYYLATTIPQTDTVRGGVRTVYAASKHPEFLLALIYDREWQPKVTEFPGFRFESFIGPGFRHSHDSLAAVTKRVYEQLTPRFGEPQFPSRYLAVVQDRLLGAGGFSVRMNNAAISGATGGGPALDARTSQTFAHETGHAWTLNATGRASNFLHEAWATFVEHLMLQAFYTADDVAGFWEQQRNAYMVGNDRQGFAGGFEGNQSILANYDNGRIHYRKGSWILYSGNYVLGDSVFDRGMRLYVDGMGKGPGGYEELIAAWSKAAGRDVSRLVMPWLRGKYIPNLEARVDGSRLIVTQQQPGELFELPKLEIELVTPARVITRSLNLTRKSDTLDLGDLTGVTAVRVDPNHRYLMQRHWGEAVVRFELPVARAPNATTVQLAGNFLRAPLAASKIGDAWVVELPMTEGRYTWMWQIGDGTPGRGGAAAAPDPTLTGTRVVRPLERVTNAYPGR